MYICLVYSILNHLEIFCINKILYLYSINNGTYHFASCSLFTDVTYRMIDYTAKNVMFTSKIFMVLYGVY